MIPARISDSTFRAVPPGDWDSAGQGECGTLHVRVDGESDTAIGFLTSAWEPNGDEIGALLAGAKIEIGISAPRQPVMRVGVGKPLDDFPPVWTIVPVASRSGSPAVKVTCFTRHGQVWATSETGNDLGSGIASLIRTIEAEIKRHGWAA